MKEENKALINASEQHAWELEVNFVIKEKCKETNSLNLKIGIY